MRSSLRLGLVSLSALALSVGCTSLLGDFTSGDGGAPGDGGGDSTNPMGDGGTGSDAGDSGNRADAADGDGASGPPVLTCNGYGLTSDLVVANLQGSTTTGHTFSRPLTIFHSPNNYVRIIVGMNAPAGMGGSSGYTVYTVQANCGSCSPQAVPITAPQPSWLMGAQQVTGGVLAFGPAGTAGAPGLTINTVFIPDAFNGNGMLPPQTLITQGQIPNQWNNLNVALTEMAANDYFYLLTYATTDMSTGAMTFIGSTGRTLGGMQTTPPTQFTTSTQQFQYSGLFNDGTSAYALIGNDPSKGDTTMQTFPGTPNGMASTPRSLGNASLGGNVLIAGGQPAVKAGSFNMAGVVVGNSLDWRIGQVTQAQLATFTGADLKLAGMVPSANQIPFNNGSGAWIGDNALFIGKGPATSVPGFNFYWFDAQGNQRVAAVGDTAGTKYGILSDHMGTQEAAITLNQIPVPALAQFDLAWIEQYPDGDGGVYEVLKYNQLVCSR